MQQSATRWFKTAVVRFTVKPFQTQKWTQTQLYGIKGEFLKTGQEEELAEGQAGR